MGSGILIGIVVLIAIVLVGFGAGIAAVPLLLIAVSVPALAAVGRRYTETKRVRDFRAKSGLDDDIEDESKGDNESIHGPVHEHS